MERTDFRAIVTDPSAGRRARGTHSNMTEHSNPKVAATGKPPPPTRAQRLAAAGFLGAFGLTILTVLLTGLKVGAPAARHVLQPAPAAVGSSAPGAANEPSSAKASAAPSVPAAQPPAADEDRKSDDAAREVARRAREDAARKAARKDSGSSDRPAGETR